MGWRKNILRITLSMGIIAGMIYPADSVRAEGEFMDREENINLDSLSQAKERAYNGNDLGAVYSVEGTTFKVWAPSATEVVLRRYSTGSDVEEGAAILEEKDMERDIGENGEWNGVWKITVVGDIVNTYYTYLVTVNDKTNETNDIYAKAVGLNGQRGMVVNLESTNPVGWDQDKHVTTEKQTDAIVWEVHIRDFSSSPNSGMSNKGKYLAFTEKGTTVNEAGELSTGVNYLKELGVNYVQLLPVFDYLNDETDESNMSYDWGYSPLNYQVPEGLYATNPHDGNLRIIEFKQMVQSLHEENIGVIMDVVFNHVGGNAYSSWFQYTVPGYYFRQDSSGNFVDSGTACGNETASEQEMFRKYMVDTVAYWASEYHIDGFRFDLMGCHDVETMNQIREALNELPGGEKILMYGEPWSAGRTNQAEGIPMANQENMKSLAPGIGAFNDFIRDSLKGHVFYEKATAFVQAGNGKSQPEGSKAYTDETLKAAIQGNANAEVPDNWTAAPGQSVAYVSCHDNLALYDKLHLSVNGVEKGNNSKFYQRDDSLVNMNKIAAAVVMTSQGTVFFQAGEEFARTKGGVENSYNSPLFFSKEKELNQINWGRREEFTDLTEYYKGLLELRRAYAPFRAADMSTLRNITFSDDDVENLIAYTIYSPGEKWDMVAVLMNGNKTPQEIELRTKAGIDLPSEWECVVNQSTAGTEVLESYQGSTMTVPAQTVLVLTAGGQGRTEEAHSYIKPRNMIKPILAGFFGIVLLATSGMMYKKKKRRK